MSQIKPIKANLPNNTFQTKPTKPNQTKQTKPTKPTKLNLPNQKRTLQSDKIEFISQIQTILVNQALIKA